MTTTIVKAIITIVNVYLVYKYISTCDVTYWRVMIGFWLIYLMIDIWDVQSRVAQLERILRKELI